MTDTVTSPRGAEDDSAEVWLTAAARPGAASVRAAVVWRVLSALCTVVQWWGVAVFAQALLSSQASQVVGGLVLAALGGAAAAFASWCAQRDTAHAATRIGGALRRRIIRGAFPARLGTSGDPAATAESAIGHIDQIADHLSAQAPLRRSATPIMIVLFVLTALVHWPAAVVLALATAMLPANMWLAGRLAQDGNDRYLHALERLGGVVLDSFRGLSTLRRLGAVGTRAATIDRASERLQRANIAVLQRAFVSGAVMDTVVTMSIAVSATYIGMTLLGYVSVPGTAPLDLGHGLFVLLLCPMYFTPMRQAAAGFHDKEKALASARLLSEREREADTATEEGTVGGPLRDAVRVSVAGLVLRAPDGAHAELLRTEGRLVAPEGEWTAIVGASGAGKTTLLTALAAGAGDTVRWDGAAGTIAPAPGSASWIGQRTVLLPGTLADNLRLGAPDADDAALLDVLDGIGLRPLFLQLPQGLLTRCGPDGYRFSAGEARRIAIARAMLRGSRLWLLDEPTAHLDAETEATVIAALRAATRGCTVVVVTHSAALAQVAKTRWTVDAGIVRTSAVSPDAASHLALGEGR